jgi:hypothetical protein
LKITDILIKIKVKDTSGKVQALQGRFDLISNIVFSRLGVINQVLLLFINKEEIDQVKTK